MITPLLTIGREGCGLSLVEKNALTSKVYAWSAITGAGTGAVGDADCWGGLVLT
jgi:hypothetical protein